VEWVETTGSTVEAAKDAALDQLGVDEQDAEFEIIEEAKSGLFGLTRREARVRARVRPTSPRPQGRAARPPTGRRESAKRSESRSGSKGSTRKAATAKGPKADADEREPVASSDAEPNGAEDTSPTHASPRPGASRRPQGLLPRPAPIPPARNDTNQEGSPMSIDDATVEQQADIIADFVEGLVEAYGLVGEVNQEKIDDETIEVQIEGDDLGLLIGPKGQTLNRHPGAQAARSCNVGPAVPITAGFRLGRQRLPAAPPRGPRALSPPRSPTT